jgi:hypothetical protein
LNHKHELLKIRLHIGFDQKAASSIEKAGQFQKAAISKEKMFIFGTLRIIGGTFFKNAQMDSLFKISTVLFSLQSLGFDFY